jgi:aryl-alcohol dehydrogenase-like predicted oxidoreductase
MQFVQLGNSGLAVSRLSFGTMSFGDQADEAAAADMYKACRDVGINVFDTADMYSKGVSEEILGRLIAGHREEVVIASKAYFPTGTGPNDHGASRVHLTRAIEKSLKRLNVERIDIQYVHRFDDKTPLEETFRTLDDLVRAGKISYIGLSNFSAWQAQKALDLCEYQGWTKPIVIQPMYNLVKRQVEVEILPMAKSEGLGVMPYSPLGGGLLTGKYTAANRPEAGRLVDNKMYALRYSGGDTYEIAANFNAYAEKIGVSPVALAVRWVAEHSAVTSTLLGARNTKQLAPALTALNLELPEGWYNEVAALSPAPPSATDRSEEGSSLQFVR